MCGFQWRIWDRIIIYISVEKSKAQNSSKTHSRPQRSLFLAHLIWTWTCLSSRFHIMQHTSHLPCEPRVSLLYHQRLSGCYRSIRNPLGASVVHMNQNSRWTCCSSWAKQLTTGHLGQVSQSFPGTSQNVLKMRRGHCLREFSQCKWGAIEIKTKDILIPTPGDIIPPLFLPKGIQKGDSFKACLIISLDHRHGVLNQYGWNQHGHYTLIRKITSFHFTLSGNFISKTKRVSNNNKQLERRKMVLATPQWNVLMMKPISKSDCRLSSENHWFAQLSDYLCFTCSVLTIRTSSICPHPNWTLSVQIMWVCPAWTLDGYFVFKYNTASLELFFWSQCIHSPSGLSN